MPGESKELGPEFSEEEQGMLGAYKKRVQQGEVGGLQDKPSEGREFMAHPEPPDWEKLDPAWKNLPQEKQDEIRALLVSKPEFADAWKLLQEGNAEAHSMGTGSLLVFKLLEERYPEWGISVKENVPVEGQAIVVFEKVPRAKMLETLHPLLSDPAVEAITEFDENDSALVEVLEQSKLLPQDAHKRLLARHYAQKIKEMEWLKLRVLASSGFAKQAESEIVAYSQQLSSLRVEPYSDAELRAILEQRAAVVLGPPKQEA